MAKCYILYSPKFDRYYIGATTLEIDVRFDHHIKKYYGNKKYTFNADDWEIYFFIECVSMTQAFKIEKHIKKMKSRKYIENMKKYPEISFKLLKKYSNI